MIDLTEKDGTVSETFENCADYPQKLLLVCASYGGGGAEKVAATLASEFVRRGLYTSYFYWRSKLGQEYSLSREIHLHKATSRFFWGRVRNLRELVHHERPDAIISFTDVPNIVTSLACIGLGQAPILLPTIHSDLAARDRAIPSTLNRAIAHMMHKYVCRASRKLVTVSEGARSSIERYYGVRPSQLECIYNPVIEKINIPRPNRPCGGHVRLVSVGRLSQAKNYPHLFRAVKRLQSHSTKVSLDIFGEGELRSDLESLVEELGLTQSVFFRGFVPDIAAQLPNYDILVMTSRWEGFSNVLVEGLNAGLRIVATDCPSGPAEILGNGKYGWLVPVDDDEALATAILDSMGTPQMAAEDLGSHLKQFTVESVADQYLRLVTTMLRTAAREASLTRT